MSEAILLFCFRSCLKGAGNEREYYDVLGIEYPKTATIDDIKKAYKKKSLETHPDKLRQRGIQVTPELQQSFLKMKEAYDVLSDPRKRRLYDELGVSGMKLIESPSEVDPLELLKNFQSNTADRWKIFLFIAFVFSVILILPILFSLKCDNRLKAPWMAIWTPMWLVDAVMAIVVCLTVVSSASEKTGENGEVLPPEESDKWHVKVLMLTETAAFILIQVLVFLRLDGNIEWSWFVVFIPWYIFEGLNILELIPIALATVPPPNLDDYHEMTPATEDDGPDSEVNRKVQLEAKYYEDLMNQFSARKDMVICVLHLWFSLFLAAKINHDVRWDWGLVMLPIWLYFALHLWVWRHLKKWGESLLVGIDVEGLMSGAVPFEPRMMVKMQVGTDLQAAASSSFYGRLPHLLLALLLVSRLEVSRFSTFLVIFPIFLIIFLCICVVGCGLCCLSSVDPEKLREQRGQMYGESHPQEGTSGVDESGSAAFVSPAEEATASLISEQTQTRPVAQPAAATSSTEHYGSFGSTAGGKAGANKADEGVKKADVDDID
jgi:hypothetical protein